jgi:N6-adenosine-specific RNA methylase IME4
MAMMRAGDIQIRTASYNMYKTIMADPPWLERGAGQCKRGADRHYNLMKTDDIISLIKSSPKYLPDESCHLWLWVTNNFLPDGLQVIDSLGFRYITNLCWVKDRIGIGRYLRGQHELCLFAVKGPAMMPEDHGVPSVVVYCPKSGHSEKPDYVTHYIERVSPPRGVKCLRVVREKDGMYGVMKPINIDYHYWTIER